MSSAEEDNKISVAFATDIDRYLKNNLYVMKMSNRLETKELTCMSSSFVLLGNLSRMLSCGLFPRWNFVLEIC